MSEATLDRLEQALNDIKQELTEIRGDINTKVAQSQGQWQQLEQRINANKEIADERNRAIWHQFDAQRRANIAIISTIVLACAALAAEILILR